MSENRHISPETCFWPEWALCVDCKRPSYESRCSLQVPALVVRHNAGGSAHARALICGRYQN